MKVLYVENHAVFASNVIREFLAQHTVKVSPSLSEARDALRSAEFDLLLVDFDLDDGKGDELVRELRDLGWEVPIIAASSHDQGNQALLRAGANAVCAKMDFGRIQNVIATVVTMN